MEEEDPQSPTAPAADDEDPQPPTAPAVDEDPQSPTTSTVDEDVSDTTEKEDEEPEEGKGDDSRVIPEVMVTPSEGHLNPILLDGRPSMALQALDRKHTWLAKLESADSKCMTTVQFVALSNHFQNYMDGELAAVEQQLPGVRGQFSLLFNKFRSSFAAAQKLRGKMFEERSLKKMMSTEGMVFERRMQQKEEEIRVMKDKMEEALKEAEERGKEMAAVRRELSDFRAKVMFGEDVEEDDTESTPSKTLGSLASEEDENKMKIMELEDQIEGLVEEIAFSKERLSIYTQKIEHGNQEMSALQKELTLVKSELQKQLALREKSDAEVGETREKLEDLQSMVRNQAEKIKKMEKEFETERNLAKSLFKDVKKFQRESEKKTVEIETTRKNLVNRDDRIKMLETQRNNLSIDLETKHIEISALKIEKAKLIKTRNELSRSVASLEETVLELESKVVDLSEETRVQQKRIEALDKEHIGSEEKIKELKKLKEDIKEEMKIVIQEGAELRLEIKLRDSTVCTLTRERDEFKKEVERLQQAVIKERKQNQLLEVEALRQGKVVQGLKSEVKVQTLKVAQGVKIEAKLTADLAEAAAKYKTVAEDNRFYRRSVAECRREIDQQSQQKDMLQLTVHHLESCNQDLDDRLKRSVADNKNVVEELRQSRETSKHWSRRHAALASKLSHAEDREQGLLKRCSQLEDDLHASERRAGNLSQEKDTLRTRLQERDRDVEAAAERIRLLEHEGSLADRALDTRVGDIRLLKLQLAEMAKSACLLEGRVGRAQDTREELTEVCKELQEQKVVVKGLEGEMQRPINLHRWRILEGTDPDRAQLVAKNHALQQQLAKKSADLDAKESALAEKDAELERMRSVLALATGQSGQDFELRRELKARADRLRGLTAENTMYEGIVKKYRKEVTDLKDALRKMKMKEFRMGKDKKRKMEDRD